MIVSVLSSGSSGNCIFVSHNQTSILIDAGLSGKKIEQHLDSIDQDPAALDAILVTHDHNDHVKGVGVLNRRHDIPLYITENTLQGAHRHLKPDKLKQTVFFKNLDTFTIGSLSIESYPTPHDAHDPVAFIISSGAIRLGVFTDIGCIFDELGELISTLDAVVLETNHDVTMLRNGSYPHFLKKRIHGDYGHLSNEQAATLLQTFSEARLKTIFLSHLSAENNRLDKIRKTFKEIIDQNKRENMQFILTRRDRPTKPIELSTS